MSTETTQSLSELADINPNVILNGVPGNTLVSFIPMSDVSDSGQWIGRQERRLDEVRLGYTPFVENDILFAKITPCMENGKGAHATGLKNRIGFGSTEFHVLRARGDNDSRFLFHWVQARATRTRAIAYMGGSAGQQRVQADFFFHFRIPRLDPREQSRIAAVLDTVDDAIAKTETVIAKLKHVRAGLLHDLLTRGLDENGQLRDPVAHPEQFQDSPLGRIPSKWLFEPLRKHTISSAYGPRFSGERYSEQGNVALLRTTDMDETGNLALQQMPLAELVFEEFRQHFLEPLDFLISRSGTCGICAVFRGFHVPVLPGAFLIRFRLAPSLLPDFLQLYANSDIGARRIRDLAEGGVQKNIRGSELLAHLVPIPPAVEQPSILRAVQLFDATAGVEETQLVKLQQLKSGIMNDLLSGRIPVPAE